MLADFTKTSVIMRFSDSSDSGPFFSIVLVSLGSETHSDTHLASILMTFRTLDHA